MKATSPASSSYNFGYAALDWCCDDGGSASLLDDKHAPLHSESTEPSAPQKPKSFFRRRAAGLDSNASASTASTQDDISTEPLMVPVDPIWEPHAVEGTAVIPVRSVSRDVPPLPPVERPPVERSDSDRAERALGPIDLDALEEEEAIPHSSSSSQDSTLGSLNTNHADSVESPASAPEPPEAATVAAVIETPALAAATTLPESPTDGMESSLVVEDPLLLLLVSQAPERSATRDPAQLDMLLQNLLHDDDLTLASSTAPLPQGDLMDALAAGPVDVDDFIPEDSYWSMNTQDFVLDEVELSRQLAGYQEGCEPPCIDHVDDAAPSSPPRARMTRQRTAATAETSELVRRAHAMQQRGGEALRRPDVVRRHVTAPSATRPVTHSPGLVRPTVTHPGVGRPKGESVRPQRSTHVVRRRPVYTPPAPLVQRAVPHSPQRPHHAPQRAVPHSPQRPHHAPQRAVPYSRPYDVPQRSLPPSPQHVVLPPALRKERRWLPDSAAEV